MEAEGFRKIGSEPDWEIELAHDRRIAIMDTLLRRLHMRGPLPLPIEISDPDSVKIAWFAIMIQTCGEAGTFFAPVVQAND